MQNPIIKCALTVAVLSLLVAVPAAAAVKEVPVGILFTYDAPGASGVTLAGSFNGWNAERNPLTKNSDGRWSVVMALKPGKHEYKFVVDGSWFADAENPATAPDSFGGTNSLVQIDDGGHFVAVTQAAAAALGPNTQLNAKVTLDGRYFGRYTATRRREIDPRFRLTRPEQLIDLNIHTDVSDVVDAYTRLRLDNTRNINLNLSTAYLDEGAVDIHPGPFRIKGFWDMELLQLGDPFGSGGDTDLAGTILDDHLPAGKGTAGVLIEGEPFGAHLQAFVADVHDADWYNSLDLFDNTGRDIVGARLSRTFAGVTFGAPFYMERELIWVDMSSVVGSGDTGITALDTHLLEHNDSSTWYEWDNLTKSGGLDIARPLAGGRGLVDAEWLHTSATQGFVTGNEAGFNNSNGPVNVELFERTRELLHGGLEWELRKGRDVNLEHTSVSETGGAVGQTYGSIFFLPQSIAEKRVYMVFGGGSSDLSTQYTDLTITNGGTGHSELLWIQRMQIDADFGVSGDVAPWSGEGEATAVIWTVSGRATYGEPRNRFGAWEIEGALTSYDDDILGTDGHTFESIARWSRELAPNVQAIFDIRLKDYAMLVPVADDREHWDATVWSPYAGVRYLPHPKLDVVLAWGVDPLSFGIDYEGRHIGRWMWRQQYMYDNPGVNEFQADRAMEDIRAIGLRANFIF